MTAKERAANLCVYPCSHSRKNDYAYELRQNLCVICITAAIQSAVDEERRSWKHAYEELSNTLKEINQIGESNTLRRIRLAVDAERRRLIPLVCLDCESDGIPVRVSDNPTWYHIVSDESKIDVEVAVCTASPIYEAIRADADR